MDGPGTAPQAGLQEDPEALARRIEQLENRIDALEGRLARLDGGRASAAPRPAPLAETGKGVLPSVSLLGLAGRLCLVFAGAYLVRSFTDAGALPKGMGVLLGLAYAAAWAVYADRAAARSRRQLASALAVSAALIAYPLLWEATVSFKVLDAPASALALTLAAAVLMAVAWRGSLLGAAWVAMLGAVGTGFALMVATTALDSFALAFLVQGGAILWLTYGRRWQGLRWPPALAADLAVLVLALLASWPGGPPEAYRGLGAGRTLALCLALVGVFLGSFVVRILARHREVIVFEGVQGALALLVGVGGALRVAHATGSGETLLGVAALLAGCLCYGAAFAFVETQSEGGRNFGFFTSLALVLVATGLLVLLGGSASAWAYVGLGLGTTLLGLRHGRWTLLAHGAVYLSCAAIASGLVARSIEAFLAPPGTMPTPFSAKVAVAFAGAAAVHVLLTRDEAELHWSRRLPSLVAGLWTAMAAGAMAVAALAFLLPGNPPEAAALAAVRTSVLAAAAAALAALGRVRPRTELRWLVYPLLGLAGLKLALSDLPMGRPLTLFPALAVFGAALLLAPRWLRRPGEDESTESNS